MLLVGYAGHVMVVVGFFVLLPVGPEVVLVGCTYRALYCCAFRGVPGAAVSKNGHHMAKTKF